jgi:ferredoxin
MADPNNKVPSNVPGEYYVDYDCIDCHLCQEIAPGLFARDEELGYSRVQKQPIGEHEVTLADDALSGCPVDAIGKGAVGVVTPAA